MKWWLVALLFASASARALEVKVGKNARGVSVRVLGIPVPETDFKKQIRSGLTTTVVSELIATEPTRTVARTYFIHYDLWDENYHVRVIEGERTRKFELRDAESVLALVRDPEFEVEKSGGAAVVRTTMNPISKEKMKRIKKWLAANNVSLPGAGVEAPAPAAVATATSAPLNSSASSPLSGARFSGVMAQALKSELSGGGSGAWVHATGAFALNGDAR